jgi:hypothetical protein
MTNNRLDDPAHDFAARDFHLARELPIRIHGKQLHDLIAEVDEVLADLATLPDEAALSSDLIGITNCLMGVQQFLQELKEKFDAAGT